MIKYRHKETGLYLTKRKIGYSSFYKLTEEGTVWQKKVMGTLSMTKDPYIYGYNQYWKPDEFEIVEFKLIEK